MFILIRNTRFIIFSDFLYGLESTIDFTEPHFRFCKVVGISQLSQCLSKIGSYTEMLTYQELAQGISGWHLNQACDDLRHHPSCDIVYHIDSRSPRGDAYF